MNGYLVDGLNVKIGRQKMHKKRIILSALELHDIGRIIGREYSFGAIIDHRFYETWGTSVYFRSGDLKYSEAFAGSGESAVARMIHSINSAKDGSLFLLDEPETSLHPGAQVEIVRFLLEKAVEKHLQIVLSTHSPSIVRYLPADAVHVLSIDPEQKVRIASSVPPEEAFYELGHPIDNTIQVIVEDLLSRQLLEQVAKSEGLAFASRFTFMFGHGGDSAMKNNSPVYMKNPRNRVHFVFDGDKQHECGPIQLSDISMESTSKQIDEIICQRLKERVKFDQDSNMAERDKVQIRLSFIAFVNERFHCLPFDLPEEAIWDLDAARHLAMAASVTLLEDEMLLQMAPKARISYLAETLSTGLDTTSQDINYVQKILISKFCSEKGHFYNKVLAMLKEIATNA